MNELKVQNDTKLKCNRCKVTLPITMFKLKRCGNRMKSCDKCRAYMKRRRATYKCKHNKQKRECKDCGGSALCEHDRIRSKCRDCGGGSICEHDRRRSRCKDCGGSQICEHKRDRSTCKECGGSQICEHNHMRSTCIPCGGGSICEHNHRRQKCKFCNLGGYIHSIVSRRIGHALKLNKELSSMEYLCCDIETFKSHISAKFLAGMTWENHGEWHIDHVIPIKYKQDNVDPSVEEICKRLHYTNTQPLWAADNISKGNRFIG